MYTDDRQSKTALITRQLLSEFTGNAVRAGQRLPSESELMVRFSVSRTTVRLALAELINQGLIERKQGLGTFRALPGRSRPPSQRSLLVGVWFNWPSGPLYGPMAEGIRDELTHHDYHAVFEGGMTTGAQSRGIETLIRKGLDGYIVSPSSNPRDPHEPIIEMLKQDVPVVLVDKQVSRCESDLVTSNGRLGAEMLVSHLIELGHRRIGFIGTSGVSTVVDRLQGYRLAMQRHGLEPDSDWIEVNELVFEDYGERGARRLLRQPPGARPTAIFGANDPIAETVARVARDSGLQVPAELSVVGFDDAGFGSEQPAWLTTYSQPKYRMGQQAAEMLMRRIRERATRRETVLLEGELILRESTAPPPSGG